MHGYTIVHMKADSAAVEDSILQHFNEYMQSKERAPSFVSERDGYFRLEYNDALGASSAGIALFGSFLQQSGYTINAISSAMTNDGEEGTMVKFMREGKEESVVVSTLNVY